MMMRRYLFLFSVAFLSISRPSHVKPVNAASVTTGMKAKAAVVLVGFTAIQQAKAGYDCRNVPTGDPTKQCGKNECCSVSEACTGLDNTSCPTRDSDINVSCKACCGNSACASTYGATVGVASCNGDSSCYNADDSTIGDHSCRGDNSCKDTTYATIGNDSCNSKFACYVCSSEDKEATVPSNSCNIAGWKDPDCPYWYNQCPYCKDRCKIQATGEDCNVSTLQATASYENTSSKCSEVNTAVVNFIKSHDDFKNPLLTKLIHAQTTAKLRQNEKGNGKKNRSKCISDFDLNFFHLSTQQEIDSACAEFESLFSNSKSALLKQLKVEFQNVPSFTVTCTRKDRNAVKK